jgi:hypothetical protein
MMMMMVVVVMVMLVMVFVMRGRHLAACGASSGFVRRWGFGRRALPFIAALCLTRGLP